MHGWKVAGAACAFAVLAGCGHHPGDALAEEDATPGLAADTASLPQTDVFLARLSFADGMPQPGAPTNVTAAPGYDNQPSFLPGKAAFYFVSEGDGGKTDIWRYDIAEGDKTRVWESPTVSEYSPKAAPGDDGVSYIQENEDGDVTRVHHMPVSGGPGGPVVDFAPLGYYAWLDGGETLGVFLRSEPPTLHTVDVADGDRQEIIQNIGRTLQPSPDGNALYFTRIDDAGAHEVTAYRTADGAISPVAPLMEGTQDFFLMFSETGKAMGLLAGATSRLYYRALDEETAQWVEASDFSAHGINNITRIAVSDDGKWIAIVAESN